MIDFFYNNYEKIIVAVSGGAIVAFIKYRFDLRKTRRERFANECSIFRDAFREEIYFLQHGPTANPLTENAHRVLSSALDKHRGSYDRFKAYVGKTKGVALDRAWQEYLYPHGKRSQYDAPLVDYINGSDETGEAQIRTLALDKLHNLLRYVDL